jgi:hypothetical protein
MFADIDLCIAYGCRPDIKTPPFSSPRGVDGKIPEGSQTKMIGGMGRRHGIESSAIH